MRVSKALMSTIRSSSEELTNRPLAEELCQAAAAVGDHVTLLRTVRRLEAAGNLARYARRRTRLLIGGNCTTAFFAQALHVALFGRGVWTERIEAGYDQWVPEALDPQAALRTFGADLAVIWLSTLGMTQGGSVRPEPDYDGIEAAVESLRQTGTKIVMILPDPLLEEENRFFPWLNWRHKVIEALRSRFSASCILLEPDPLIRRVGAANWYAPRYWTTSKLACHPNASVLLAQDVASVIAQIVNPTVKLIVTDLDDTLWGGIVGEESAQGVSLDPHGTGVPYLRLQRFLKDATAAGIAVAVVSKNNEADALEVFDTRTEMILRREDLVGYRINWEEKSKNIIDLVQMLNLGLEHVCFLDDNPVERNAVRCTLPEITVPELPADPEEVVPFLVGLRLWERPLLSQEDRSRIDYYKQDAMRRELAARALHVRDYLEGLEQTLAPSLMDNGNLDRVETLINKTNQFNLATRRHGASQLAAWAADETAYAYCFRVTDRFGDAGIVGVLLALPEGPSTILIDTWLLSCRVMGRTVEDAMFAHLVEWCRIHRIEVLLGEFLPTKKNTPVAELYDRLGFTRVSEDASTGRKLYRTELQSLPPIHHCLSLTSTGQGA